MDILGELDGERLVRVLNEICSEPPFFRVEEDDRGDRGLPSRRHFKLYYNSVIQQNNRIAWVILDVVNERNLYPNIRMLPISGEFIELERDVKVAIPTVEGLLGDKLTAFAPNTTGVPCTEDTALQMMKQVYDIGLLFDAASNIEDVVSAYRTVFNAENGYRGGGFSLNDVVIDTIRSAKTICEKGLRGASENSFAEMAEKGRRSLQSHVLSSRCTLDDIETAAAKAAYVAALAVSPETGASLCECRYSPDRTGEIAGVSLNEPYTVLNRLRANQEALFYWHKISAIMNHIS